MALSCLRRALVDGSGFNSRCRPLSFFEAENVWHSFRWPIHAKFWNNEGPFTKLWSTNFATYPLFVTTGVCDWWYQIRQILSTEPRLPTTRVGRLCFPPTKIDKCLQLCFLSWGKLKCKLLGKSHVWNECLYFEVPNPERGIEATNTLSCAVCVSHERKSLNVSEYVVRNGGSL